MKNTQTGKMLTQILSVLLCAVILIMLGATFCPYYTIAEPYHFILNPNPVTDHYTLVDVMWTNTPIITTYFENQYSNFDINNYVTSMVLSFVFALAALITSVVFAKDVYKKYPSMTSGVLMHISAVCCSIFSLMAYLSNDMLDLGISAFMYTRTIIIICSVAVTVLTIVRFVLWLLTEIQLHKELKARLALL